MPRNLLFLRVNRLAKSSQEFTRGLHVRVNSKTLDTSMFLILKFTGYMFFNKKVYINSIYIENVDKSTFCFFSLNFFKKTCKRVNRGELLEKHLKIKI